MSRSIVRRFAVVVALAAVLGTAAPAAAAPHSFPMPATLQLSLMAKVLGWIESFLPVPPAEQRKRTGPPLDETPIEVRRTTTNESDYGALVDPNG